MMRAGSPQAPPRSQGGMGGMRGGRMHFGQTSATPIEAPPNVHPPLRGCAKTGETHRPAMVSNLIAEKGASHESHVTDAGDQSAADADRQSLGSHVGKFAR